MREAQEIFAGVYMEKQGDSLMGGQPSARFSGRVDGRKAGFRPARGSMSTLQAKISDGFCRPSTALVKQPAIALLRPARQRGGTCGSNQWQSPSSDSVRQDLH